MTEKDSIIEGQTASSTAATYEKSPEELAAAAEAEAKKDKATKETKGKSEKKDNSSGKAPKTRKASALEAEAIKILKDYPDMDRVYMTSDGFGYFDEHDARNHARTLQNDAVITIAR